MKKVILYTVVAILICCNYSCDQEDGLIIDDPNYPTTFYRLSEETLLQKRNDFAKKNPEVYTTLNQFGFCAMGDSYGTNGPSGGFTEKEATAAVKDFVARNPEYTGVKNPKDLKFRMIEKSIIYNNAVSWCFRTENQTIRDIEVDYSEFVFHTRNEKLVYCDGNHFPNVYIPKKFNFDSKRAKSQLLGKEVSHWGWRGPSSFGKIKAEHLQKCATRLIIITLRSEEKIELRLAWQIEVDAMYYIFCVDVMTGEIIQEEPTIIS